MNKQLQRYVDKELFRVEKDRKKLSKRLADIISQLSGIKKDIEKYNVLVRWDLVTHRASQYNQELVLLDFQSAVFYDLNEAIVQDDVQSVVSYYEKILANLKTKICEKCEREIETLTQLQNKQRLEKSFGLTRASVDLTSLEDIHSGLEKAHFLADVLEQVKAIIEVNNETH